MQMVALGDILHLIILMHILQTRTEPYIIGMKRCHISKF